MPMGEKISISSGDKPHHKPIRPLPDQARSTESSSSSTVQPWSSKPIYVSHPIFFHKQPWHKIHHNVLHVGLVPLSIKEQKQPFRNTTRSESRRPTQARSKPANEYRQNIKQSENVAKSITEPNENKNASNQQKSNNLSIQFEIKILDSSATKPNQVRKLSKSNNITTIQPRHNPLNTTEITQRKSKSNHSPAKSISSKHGIVKPSNKPNRIVSKLANVHPFFNNKNINQQSDNHIPGTIDAAKQQSKSDDKPRLDINPKPNNNRAAIYSQPKRAINSAIHSKSNRLTANIQHQHLQNDSSINKPKSNNHAANINRESTVSKFHHYSKQSNVFIEHNDIKSKSNPIIATNPNKTIKNSNANNAATHKQQHQQSKPIQQTNDIKINTNTTRIKRIGQKFNATKQPDNYKITANTQNGKKKQKSNIIQYNKSIVKSKQQHSKKFNSIKFNGRKKIANKNFTTNKQRTRHVNLTTAQKNAIKNPNTSSDTLLNLILPSSMPMMPTMENAPIGIAADNMTMSVDKKSKNHQIQISRSKSNVYDYNKLVGNLLQLIGHYL